MPAAKPFKAQQTVPRVGRISPGEEYGRVLTFTTDHVRLLIERAGLTPEDGLNFKSIARRLGTAAYGFVMMFPKLSTDAEVLAWARRIHAGTLEWLALMGADPHSGRLQLSTFTSLAPIGCDESTTKAIRDAMGLVQVRGSDREEKMSDDEPVAIAEGRRTRHELKSGVDFIAPTARQVLQLTAYGAACTVQMAQDRIEALGKPERRPRQPRTAEVQFIGDLCGIYSSICGRRETLTLKGPAIEFCRAAAQQTKKMLELLPASADTNLRNLISSTKRFANQPTVVRDRIRDFRAGDTRAR
jgi:hypothetical protein